MQQRGDFRDFLSYLEERKELVRISKQVSTKYEIAAYIRKSSNINGPGFLFESVAGYEGWNLAGGIYGTRNRIALSLRSNSPSDAVRKFGEAIKNPVKPVTVNKAPCQEIIWEKDEVDLMRLPAVWHSEKDAGYYISSAVQFANDPDTGILHLGMHRMQIQRKNRTGLSFPPDHRVARAFFRSEAEGKPLEMAAVIGAGPYVDLASQAKIPHSEEKLGIAGALRGGPVELVKCKTINVHVPAHAEIVLEGRVLSGVREPEGPFGEVMGTYGDRDQRPVFEISAITMRRDRIYQTALTGMPSTENHHMGWLAVCESTRRFALNGCPEVVGVNAIGPRHMVFISIRKRMEHEAANVIMSVLGPTAGAPQSKYCIVVDDDIDVNNIEEVLWAMYTRVQPDKDIYIYPVMVGSTMDPSAPIPRHSSKVGIDATVPLGKREQFEPVRVPGTENVTW